MILGSMLRVFSLAMAGLRARIENNAWTRYYMMLWCLMIVYFLNNISTRYLFSFGSPFSLCILCLWRLHPRELAGEGRHARVAQKQVAPAAAPAPRWPGTGLAADLPAGAAFSRRRKDSCSIRRGRTESGMSENAHRHYTSEGPGCWQALSRSSKE